MWLFDTFCIFNTSYHTQSMMNPRNFMTIARNRIPSLNMYHIKIGMATIAYIMVMILPRSVFGTISPYPTNILSQSYIWKNVWFIKKMVYLDPQDNKFVFVCLTCSGLYWKGVRARRHVIPTHFIWMIS